jgi:hypothetical protein
MDHCSQRYWFCLILRWFKLDFFGEAFQISEYIFEIPDGSLVWPAIPFQRKIEAPLICTALLLSRLMLASLKYILRIAIPKNSIAIPSCEGSTRIRMRSAARIPLDNGMP